MRLFLLPISTRRALLYCERLPDKPPRPASLLARAAAKASETWAAWESDDKALGNWKKNATLYGNRALSRIPYEEWGLKTLPALTAQRKQALLDGRETYELLFPGRYLREHRLPAMLHHMATERQRIHRAKLLWSILLMPLTAPFMLVPIVPNLPFFYVLYRAYSHWTALNGSKFLAFLLQHKLPTPTSSWPLDQLYTAGLMYPTRQRSHAAPTPTEQQASHVAALVHKQTHNDTKDVMVLQRWNAKLIAEHLQLPDMQVDMERAVEQVEQSIRTKAELIEEKRELEKATAMPDTRADGALSESIADKIHAQAQAQLVAEKAGRQAHARPRDARQRI
ncbi:hypothetical protein ACEQ8H_008256 [Pleosporales sp. CAS-2024a]